MPEHQILLSEDIYQVLSKVAQEKGLTPAEWIATQLPSPIEKEVPLAELLEGLVGAIDSQEEPRHQFKKTSFGL